MIKRLFVEVLPLASYGNLFHEIAVLIEIDNEIKAAYHYKIKLDNKPYQLEVLESQGYGVNEIKDNPQSFYEVYGGLLKLLESYVNAFDDQDFLILYSWNKRSNSIFRSFMNDNGIRNLESYVFKFPVLVNSILIDKFPDVLTQMDQISLDSFNDALGNKGVKRDALSRVVSLYQLYKAASGVQTN